MTHYLTNNLGTICVVLVLAAIVFGIVVKLRKDKKQGNSSCGCGCAHCAMAGQCHGKTSSDTQNHHA